MCGSRKFCQRRSNVFSSFLVDEGEGGSKYHYTRAIIDPPAKRYLNIECWFSTTLCPSSFAIILMGKRERERESERVRARERDLDASLELSS